LRIVVKDNRIDVLSQPGTAVKGRGDAANHRGVKTSALKPVHQSSKREPEMSERRGITHAPTSAI
jgi:hypothetical protein